MNKKGEILFLKIAITLGLVVLAWGMTHDIQAGYRAALEQGERLPYSVMTYVAVCVLVALFFMMAAWLPAVIAPVNRLRNRLGWLNWLPALAAAFAISWLFCYSTAWSRALVGNTLRTAGFLAAAAVMAWLLSYRGKNTFEWVRLLVVFLLMGTIFTFAYQFRTVMDYPFSLFWSEGNRFWDYSVLFGRRLYDYPAGGEIFAYIDDGRQSLWGMIFLLPHVSILGMRLWNALLFTVPYILLGWTFLRVTRQHMRLYFFFGLWCMLFLNQGPIYTPLVLAAILVAYTRRTPLWLGMILTALAGYYAISSRFTWLFAPAIWAGLIAFLEIAPHGVRTTAQRWWRAILLGMAGLAGGYILPELIRQVRAFIQNGGAGGSSGLISAEGLSSMVGRQALLWDRLLPNSTYAPGILLGLAMAAGPLLALLIYLFAARRWKLNLWQALALAGSLLAFLVVGLVASVKIGGGSNLHNLDMFLISLVFAAGLALESILQDEPAKRFPSPRSLPWGWQALVLAAIVIPAFHNVFGAVSVALPPEERVVDALKDMRREVEMAKEKGDILFIDQRQLLTFGYISGVRLVPEYEKKYMMDLAMADDAEYFDVFYQDLANHRFSLIVTEPLNANVQDDEFSFDDENNSWVRWVSIPILCYYEPVFIYQDVGLMVLTPKTEKSSPYPEFECPAY